MWILYRGYIKTVNSAVTAPCTTFGRIHENTGSNVQRSYSFLFLKETPNYVTRPKDELYPTSVKHMHSCCHLI